MTESDRDMFTYCMCARNVACNSVVACFFYHLQVRSDLGNCFSIVEFSFLITLFDLRNGITEQLSY